MLSSQQIVVRVIEYAAAGAMLLLAAKIALIWLRQPADRINLILMTFVAASIVPLLASFAPAPAWHLGMVGAAPPLQSPPRPILSETHALPAPRPQTESERNEIGQPPTPAAASGAALETDSRSLPPATKVPDRLAPWNLAAMGLLTIHALATALLVVEWVVGVRWLRRMAARALLAGETVRGLWTSVTEGRGGSVRVLVSWQVDTPLAYGCVRPTVVIPKLIAEGDLTALRCCLAHEWSHIERGDLRGWRLVWFCQFLLWFQPLFWILRRELRVCQDFLADRRAASAGSDAIEYSQLLLEFSRRRMSRPVAGAIAFLDRSSQLSRRIKMLITSPLVLRSRSPVAFCLMAGTMSLVCAALFGAIRLDSVRGGDDAQPASSENTKPARSKEQPEAKAETLHYTCVVLDKETGKGIPEASVVVRRSKLTSQEETLIEETRHKTDAEGKYSFELPPAQVAESALYIELDVEHEDYAARKGFGYALSMIRKNELLGERPFFEKTELRPSEPTTGTVVDPDGKALVGVKIQGFSMSNASDFRDYHSFTDTVTDEAGKFRLNLVKGGAGVLWVLPTEYASTSRAVDKERGDIGEIRLRPGVRVSGQVLSAEGKPVPGIPVNIQYEGGGNETVNNLPVSTSIRRSAITDGDGRFAFDPLPSGEYRVIPEEHRDDPIVRDRTRHEIAGVFLPVKVTIQEGVAAAPIEIQASPHVLINAQILDSKGNKTRGHAFHVFGRMDGQYWFGEGRPNSEGTISMRVPHGLQNVQLNLMTNEHGALRFRRGKGKELENDKSRVELGTLNDDVEGFEIIRYLAPIVLVNAVDAEGKQVNGFRVSAAYPWGKQQYILEGEQRSDLSFERQDDGRYRTSQMLPDEDVKFTVTAAGYETASETVRLAEGETKDLVLTLKPKDQPAEPKPDRTDTLRYTGVVIDKETGKGIPNATVVVRRSKSTPEENTIIEETRHQTDAEGKYSFENPPEQVAESALCIQLDVEHDAYVAKKEFGYALLSSVRTNETLGKRPFFERVELRASDPITGTVVDPQGKPLAGVRVLGYSSHSRMNLTDFRDAGSFTDAVTNEAGKFRLSLVKGGVGVFWVLPAAYASTSRAVNKERGDVGEIRLRPGVRVSGRVLSAEGKPVPNIPVNIQYAGGGNETVNDIPVATSIRRGATADLDGNFAFDPLPSGEYRVIPEERRSDPVHRDRTRHEVPGVFLPVTVKIQEGIAAAPIEIQASPHIVFNAQSFDSQGAKTVGSEVYLSGQIDGQHWFGEGRPNSEGAISMRVPHGLQNVYLNPLSRAHGALRFRRGKGKKLENRTPLIELGTLNDDFEGFEIIHYRAPIVLVGAVDAGGKPVKDFRVTAAYPRGKQEYILEGELGSDLNFEHQDDGRYRTALMLPDEDVKFTVTAAGYEAASETVRLAEGETKDLVLTLKMVESTKE